MRHSVRPSFITYQNKSHIIVATSYAQPGINMFARWIGLHLQAGYTQCNPSLVYIPRKPMFMHELSEMVCMNANDVRAIGAQGAAMGQPVYDFDSIQSTKAPTKNKISCPKPISIPEPWAVKGGSGYPSLDPASNFDKAMKDKRMFLLVLRLIMMTIVVAGVFIYFGLK